MRQRKVSFHTFKSEVLHSDNFSPVFFLSTGRCGTKFFNELFADNGGVHAVHSSKSDLIEQGKICYEALKQNDFNDNRGKELINRLSGQILLTAREHVFYESFLHDKRYVETNNRITFFAFAMHALMPGARFVHLVRHPGDFIRSGIRRGWYKGSSPHDHGRLVPVKGTVASDKWESWDDIQKIAWLWNETNQFIEEFKEVAPDQVCFFFNFDELNGSKVESMLEFMGLPYKSGDIESRLFKPLNVQKEGSYPNYQDWQEEDKSKVREICGELSSKYGYEL